MSSVALFSAPSVLSPSLISVLGPRFSFSLAAAPSNTNRAASASSGSSSVIVTSANPIGGRFVVPLKMQSAMRSARSDLWLCSPSTHEMASTTFDFPHPFGPTMQVVPVPLNVTTVRSQNDLKPTISTFRSLSKVSPFVPRCTAHFRFAPTFAPRNPYPSRQRSPIPSVTNKLLRRVHSRGTPCKRNQSFILLGKEVRRRQSDRDAVARQNVWQVLDQSPAAWRVNGGTGKNTNTIPCPCKASRNW